MISLFLECILRCTPNCLVFEYCTFLTEFSDNSLENNLTRYAQFLTGLLGTITKTADVSDCPGKCLHALASLLCEEVKEDISCPSQSMRCCVDRKHMPRPGGPPSQNLDEADTETTTKFRVRPVPARTTTSAPTTTTTTTIRTPPRASDKQDKFGDYDYTDTNSDPTSSASRTSNTASAFFATVLCCMSAFYRFI